LLLAAGADPRARNSKQLTAFDVAKEANRNGSHADVLGLLEAPVKVVALRDFLRSNGRRKEHRVAVWSMESL
ncbi:unnamed protein product, partial [Effrenium voratum]